MYPVMLNVRDRSCLVVGGGGVALRKVDGLLAQGARVFVVAPDPMPALEALAQEGSIGLEQRSYRSGEATGYQLVFAATDDREVNREVFEDADGAGIWVNVADDPELCAFHLPARVQRGALQLAIASAGEAPFVVRRLRQMLERRFGPEWGEWMQAAARFRRAVREKGLPQAEQEICFDAFFSGTINPDRLTARVPTADQEVCFLAAGTPTSAAGAPAEAGQDTQASEPEQAPGLVSLVGAGPGDPGLLTLRGRQRLLAADVVVYDRLAETALPCDLAADVELRCVGKQADHHPVPQEEINALLVRLAKRGKRVVRLKGGDPYVFGRGGEEAEELRRAGVPFEVVPCVTAGIAAPAYAGIPVTHRKEVVRVTIVTAHEAAKTKGPQVRWDLLAADPHATLLGYMGVSSLDLVAKQLLASGMNPKTPAAMIERGSTSRQRVVRSIVSRLSEDAAAGGIQPPAIFVIGPTVDRADLLDWFGERPLLGSRLVVPAPAGSLREPLELAGVEVVEVPLPITPAARIVMNALPLTGCLLRSAVEVETLDEEREGPSWSEGTVAWCLGTEAAERARELGWRMVAELDAGASAEAVIAVMIERAGATG